MAERQGYDGNNFFSSFLHVKIGMTLISHPVGFSSQHDEPFPISTQISPQGGNISKHSSPSPPSPSGSQPAGIGRRGSKSSTAKMTMQQLNKKRYRATPDQLSFLKEAFLINNSPNAKMREMIAKHIRMTERSVQIWFQNRYFL